MRILGKSFLVLVLACLLVAFLGIGGPHLNTLAQSEPQSTPDKTEVSTAKSLKALLDAAKVDYTVKRKVIGSKRKNQRLTE